MYAKIGVDLLAGIGLIPGALQLFAPVLFD